MGLSKIYTEPIESNGLRNMAEYMTKIHFAQKERLSKSTERITRIAIEPPVERYKLCSFRQGINPEGQNINLSIPSLQNPTRSTGG
jgi:hypothetical protein